MSRFQVRSPLSARSHRRASSGYLLALGALAASASVAACSARSAPKPEATASETSALLDQTGTGTLTNASLTLAVDFTNFWGSSLTFSNGKLNFVPSPCGSADLTKSLSPASFAVPSTVVSVAGTNYGVYFTSLSTTSFLGSGSYPYLPGQCPTSLFAASSGSLELTPSGVSATIELAGAIHLAAGAGGFSILPSFDVVITPASTLTVTLAWDRATQTFHVAPSGIVADLKYDVANCLGGLCNSIVQSAIPDLDSLIAAKLAPVLNAALTDPGQAPKIATGLGSALAEVWNNLHPVSGVPWHVAPGSIWYDGANSQFVFEVVRPVPPACTYQMTNDPSAHQCNGGVNTYCPDTYAAFQNGTTPSEPVYVFKSASPSGPWTQIWTAAYSWTSPTWPVLTEPSNSTVYLMACTGGGPENGGACDSPTALVVEQYSCNPSTVCVPATCGSYCGALPDGCGGFVTCPGCPAGYACDGNICMAPSTCPTPPKRCPAGTVWDDVACSCTCVSTRCQGGNL